MSISSAGIASERGALVSRISDYRQLIRPRISVLVLVVVGVSGFVARWGRPDPWALVNAMFGTLLVAGSASALNQLLEQRRDAVMARTAGRPLPAGRMSGGEVLAVSLAAVVVGTLYLGLLVNWHAAGWSLASWVLYVFIYTPLKTRSSLNTFVGAVPGALPVLIGWTAVGGTLDMTVDPRGTALFLVVLLWQFPHFMAIAWMYRSQYATAGMRMLSVVDPAGRLAAVQAVTGAAMLAPISVAAVALTAGPQALMFAVAALVVAGVQVYYALRFWRLRSDVSARAMLRISLLYLPSLFALLIAATWM